MARLRRRCTGHGDRDRSATATYSYADFGADVLTLCEWLDEPPFVIGASMGGIAALVAQGTFEAQLYHGLVLVDITPNIDMDGGRRILSFMSADPNGNASLNEAVEAIAAYRGPGHGKPSEQGLTRVLKQGTDGRWRWHWDPRLLCEREAWLADPNVAAAHRARMRRKMLKGADKLKVPTLLVRGGSSGVVTLGAAEELLQLLPHVQFVNVADASHMVAGDRKVAFSAAVNEFALPLINANRRPMSTL